MTALHLLRLPLDSRALMALCAAQGLVSDRFAADRGYLLHVGLKAAFGEAAPKPFLLDADENPLPVLAYSPHALAALRTRAAVAATGLVRWEAAGERQLPLPFPAGRRLGFAVTACPTVRIARGVGSFDAGSEQDAYVAWLRREGFPAAAARDPADRTRVYADWLAARLAPAARLDEVLLTSLRAARLWRKVPPVRPRGRTYGPDGAERRRGHGSILDRRAASFAGTLTVLEPAGFATLLARGIGRHRAFGFGLLLLRPAVP